MTKFLTPKDAELAFYEAFETGDLAAMMSVWSVDDDIACIHPQGPRLDGRAAIDAAWREILPSSVGVRVKLTEIREFVDQAIAVHCVYENLWLPGEGAPRPPILATNVYRYSKRGWHMVLHHASAAPYEEGNGEKRAVLH